MQDRTLSHFVTWPGHWSCFVFMSRWMALWLKEILDSWFWNCQIAWTVICFGCSLLSSCIWRRQFVPSTALKKQSANRHYKKNDIELFRNTLKARKCWGLSYNIQRGDAHRRKKLVRWHWIADIYFCRCWLRRATQRSLGPKGFRPLELLSRLDLKKGGEAALPVSSKHLQEQVGLSNDDFVMPR